jgi:hypothetical protein
MGDAVMAQAAKAQEPSMEEILASIRRIIADDETKPPQRAVDPGTAAPRPSPPPELAEASPPPAPPTQEFDFTADSEEPEPQQPAVFELTEDMAVVSQQESAEFRTIDGQSDVVFADPQLPRSPPEPPQSEPSVDLGLSASRLRQDERLLSGATSASVDSAFHSLAHAVLAQNARTLEDLVQDMLRPMLKTWLDDNLPGLVERLVRAEIERVSRGRG